MEERVEIIGKVLRLTETTEEGLRHVYERTKNGRFDTTVELFTDIVSAFYEMERALLSVMIEVDAPELEEKTREVVESMRVMLLAYEGDRDVRPMEILQFSLLPCFNNWQTALHDYFGEQYASTLN